MPVAEEPLYSLTVTVVESPGSVPAVPANVGVGSVVSVPSAGVVNVITGGTVSGVAIVKVLALLFPVLPASSPCSARAV